MATTTFDTLGYCEKLKAAGFTDPQAKAQADALRDIIEDKLATKRDLQEMKTELMAEIAKSRAETIKWTAGLLIAQAAVVAALVKLL